jgi:hypothetical protein
MTWIRADVSTWAGYFRAKSMGANTICAADTDGDEPERRQHAISTTPESDPVSRTTLCLKRFADRASLWPHLV